MLSYLRELFFIKDDRQSKFSYGNPIVSTQIFERKFVCDLNACKGACCVDGDAGAPLDEDEVKILDDIYNVVKPYLREEGARV